ncbi:MAG TPA: glutamine--fructose-6-phosphate transaminase (isomerizing) [bacterium]|jgi:glucosamine--fructose-6-phosphate aminotransferase (isomerizing)|nr:glutamine--fructose-6-phosphate transaminase (isomerizing) [bacterium]
MCGIVGFVGKGDAVPVLLGGLRKLEYRGYDSAGLACVNKGGVLELRRAVGKLAGLETLMHKQPMETSVGVGHTRWATHGRPNEANAHPHAGAGGRLAIVHNGIVENYLELRKELQGQGVVFRSETDSEVLAHLIEKAQAGGLKLVDAVRAALKRIEGSYALVVVSADEPEHLVVARLGSPLVLGLGAGSNYIASDVPALLEHTRDVVYLDDGEVAEVGADGWTVTGLDGSPRTKKVQRVTWDPMQAEKAGYKHFMLKEIYEQPRVIEDTLRGRISKTEGDVHLDLEEAGLDAAKVRSLDKVVLVACGTSWHAALVGKFLIEDLARIGVEVDIASEFRYRDPLVGPGTLVVGISQSGETADTLAAMRLATSKGATGLAICNVVGATMTREAKGTLYTHAGPEIGVASTKAFTAQVAALVLLAVFLGRRRGSLREERAKELLAHLREVPGRMERCLKADAEIKTLAARFSSARDVLYLGRGVNYPIALEGALKLKEISYIHAEGYPAGEMKHGPIALIDENLPVVAIAVAGKVFEKTLSNIEEARARGAQVLAVVTEGERSLDNKAAAVLSVPAIEELLSPLLVVLPLQLLAYHLAVKRGCDVDQPRNLAKSVTVE